jgi:hypothetical protein
MKRSFLIMTAAALLVCAASCNSQKAGKVPHQKTTTATEEETSQPDPLEDITTTTGAKTATTSKISTTAAAETTAVKTTEAITTQPDPLGGGAFEYNADGAVVFESDINAADDRTLIAAAQALYTSACRTEWDFTVGCPFNIDQNSYIEAGTFSWRYYLITDSDINSYADVVDAYHKVFSSRYTSEELPELYCDKDGSAYALCGNRGANIYYSSSKITGVKSRTDDEIVFTVENYYDGSDYGEGAHTETEEFSAVIEDGNVWKAGKFKLPY